MLLFLTSCWARAEVAVSTEEGGFIQVDAQFVSPATPNLVWQALTDYDHLAEFVPDMLSSRLLSAQNMPIRIEQKGRSSFMFLSFPIEVVFEIYEHSPTDLRFNSLSGSLSNMSGHYKLTPLHGGTRIEYTARFRPDFYVPPFISSAIMRRSINRQFDGLLHEIERRHAAFLIKPHDPSE